MIEGKNIIHSVDEEKERIAEIMNNPRIINAYRKVQHEGSFIDKLLDILDIDVKDRHDKMALSHLEIDDKKLIENFRTSRFDSSLSEADKDKIHELLRDAVSNMDHLTSASAPSPRRGRQM